MRLRHKSYSKEEERTTHKGEASLIGLFCVKCVVVGIEVVEDGVRIVEECLGIKDGAYGVRGRV